MSDKLSSELARSGVSEYIVELGAFIKYMRNFSVHKYLEIYSGSGERAALLKKHLMIETVLCLDPGTSRPFNLFFRNNMQDIQNVFHLKCNPQFDRIESLIKHFYKDGEVSLFYIDASAIDTKELHRLFMYALTYVTHGHIAVHGICKHKVFWNSISLRFPVKSFIEERNAVALGIGVVVL